MVYFIQLYITFSVFFPESIMVKALASLIILFYRLFSLFIHKHTTDRIYYLIYLIYCSSFVDIHVLLSQTHSMKTDLDKISTLIWLVCFIKVRCYI